MAALALGGGDGFDWLVPPLEQGSEITAHPAVRRALALLQAARPSDAARGELRPLVEQLPYAASLGVLALASQAGLADVSHKVGKSLERRSATRFDAGLYQVPYWRPQDGFRIDRALIYAVVRQESRFRIDATSPADARGL